MAPRDAKLEPKGPQKYEKDTKMYPRVQTCRQKCHNEATGYVPCQKSTTRPPKVGLRHQVRPQGAKKHVQTTRGRVLAEGDVDPAAGRGTTHQAASRRPRGGAEAGVRGTSTQVLCSCIQLTGCRLCRRPSFLSSRAHPKRRQKNVEKTKGTNGGSKSENKKPKPQSDNAGAVQTLFAIFYKNSKYH